MPSFKDKLSDEEIREVAEFVATSAGKGEVKKFTFEPNDKNSATAPATRSASSRPSATSPTRRGPKAALTKLDEMQKTDPRSRRTATRSRT